LSFFIGFKGWLRLPRVQLFGLLKVLASQKCKTKCFKVHHICRFELKAWFGWLPESPMETPALGAVPALLRQPGQRYPGGFDG
jgi:hypothetical protein